MTETDYKKEWAETIPEGEFCNGCRAYFVDGKGHYNCALYGCDVYCHECWKIRKNDEK